MARFGLLLVILVGCGHTAAGRQQMDSAPPIAVRDSEAQESEAPAAEAPVAAAPARSAPAGERSAQVITFDDDADPEPTMMVRSPPARPKIPSFQLFGTRSSDGPR